MTAPQRPTALTPLFNTVPQHLRDTPRWVLWRYTLMTRGGKQVWAKVPKQASGRNASSTDAGTWCSFDRARQAYEASQGAPSAFSGIGLIIDGSDDLVGIDLDDCVEPDVLTGEPVLNQLALDAISRLPGYWEISPSGTGVKGFVRARGVGSQKDDGKGIEVYADGRYFTVTGRAAMLGDSSAGHLWREAIATDITEALLPWITEHLGGVAARRVSETPVARTGDEALDAFLDLNELPQPLTDWPLDRVRTEILPHLDVECSYDEWIRIGAALHHQFEGSDEGFELWDTWAQASSKYADEAYGRERWDSFGRRKKRGQVTTLASLIKQTEPARRAAAGNPDAAPPWVEPAVPAADDASEIDVLAEPAVPAAVERARKWVAQVQGTGDLHNLEQLCSERIAKDNELDEAGRLEILESVRQRTSALGIRVPIDTLRRWLRRGGNGGGGGAQRPPELAYWVYLTQEDRFYDLESRSMPITSAAFDTLFDRIVPPGSTYESATMMFRRVWQGPTCDRRLYAPGQDDVFTLDGVRYANAYNPWSVPDVAPDPAVDAVLEEHMRRLLPDERDRRLLTSWLAHNVQRPGVLIGWAPYVCSRTTGTGKSALGRMLKAAMGSRNIGSVAPKSLHDKFTGWANGYAVNVLDEVKLHGENKYDVANGLKPYITERHVPLEGKGKDAVTVPNFTNYMLLSNYEDGMPTEEGDRRYAFFLSHMTKAEVEEGLASGHYQRLFDALETQPGAVRAWLLAYPIDPEIVRFRAPETTGRAQILEATEPETLTATRQLLLEGRKGVNAKAVSTKALAQALRERLGYRVAGPALASVLARLGFHRYTRAFKFEGEVVGVWTSDALGPVGADEHDRVRAALEETGDPTEFDVL